MSKSPLEQRNIYRGVPARAWLCLELISPSGLAHEMNVLVDTGNPCAIIVDSQTMNSMRWRQTVGTDSNFGHLDGGWLRIAIPELEFDVKLLGFANDAVANVVKRSDSEFGGLIGLPFLRLFEYGGDAGRFWIRPNSG